MRCYVFVCLTIICDDTSDGNPVLKKSGTADSGTAGRCLLLVQPLLNRSVNRAPRRGRSPSFR